jgi:hypothetical protein
VLQCEMLTSSWQQSSTHHKAVQGVLTQLTVCNGKFVTGWPPTQIDVLFPEAAAVLSTPPSLHSQLHWSSLLLLS